MSDTVAVVSPHFDDAVLFASGRMQRWRERGADVVVATLFGGPGESAPPSRFARGFHVTCGLPLDVDAAVRARDAEDATALERLGVSRVVGALPEAIYRRSDDGTPLVAGSGDLFDTSSPLDPRLLLSTIVTLFPLVADATHVWVPLGLGDHIDHVLARLAGETVARQVGASLSWYGETLYHLTRPGSVETRPPGSRGPAPIELSETEWTAKTAACAAYASQMRMFGAPSATPRGVERMPGFEALKSETWFEEIS
jgi:LmbE family N-acetylglucosaminyl deacetylase